MKLFPAMLLGTTSKTADIRQIPQNLPRGIIICAVFKRITIHNPRKNFLMGLTYLAVDKVPGYYEEQKFPTDMGSKAMLGVTIGVTMAYPSREDLKVAETALGFLPF